MTKRSPHDAETLSKVSAPLGASQQPHESREPLAIRAFVRSAQSHFDDEPLKETPSLGKPRREASQIGCSYASTPLRAHTPMDAWPKAVRQKPGSQGSR